MAKLSDRSALWKDPNLVSYWSMDGSSADSKGSAVGSDTAVTYVNGKYDRASSFNGTTSVINLPNATGVSGGTARTLSMWVNDGAGVGTKTLIGWTPNPGTTLNQFIILTGTNAARDIYVWTNGADVFSPTNTLVQATWVHLGIVYDGGSVDGTTVHIYLNGVLVNSGTSIGTPGAMNTTDTNGQIGSNVLSGVRFFDGQLDDIGFWNRALTATEINQLALERGFLGSRGIKPHPFSPGLAR